MKTTLISKNNLRSIKRMISCLLIASTLLITGCYNKDYTKREFKAEEMLVADYLQSDSLQDYTEFVRMLDKTGYLNLLATWGTFTVFAPTNEAIRQFLTENGKSSIDEFSTEYLVTLVKTHLLVTSIVSSAMTAGKLADTTMNGDFLRIAYSDSGFNSTMINKRATILKRDIICSNGVIHKISKVLYPVTDNILTYLTKHPEYSIMLRAITETGYDSVLRVVYYMNEQSIKSKNSVTLFLESDSVLALSGILNYDSLLRQKASVNPKNKEDGLNQFVSFHILKNAVFSEKFENKNYETFNSSFLLNAQIQFIDRANVVVLNTDTAKKLSVKMLKNNDIVLQNGVLQPVDRTLSLIVPPAIDLVVALLSNDEMAAYFAYAFSLDKYETPWGKVTYADHDGNARYKILSSDTVSNFKFKYFHWSIVTDPGRLVQPEKRMQSISPVAYDEVCYVHDPSGSNNFPYWNCSYIWINSYNTFTLNFTTQKIPPGKYNYSIGYKQGARYKVKVLLDGAEVDPDPANSFVDMSLSAGYNYRYTQHAGNAKWKKNLNNFVEYLVGTTILTGLKTHVITITNDFPGGNAHNGNVLNMDYIRFNPAN